MRKTSQLNNLYCRVWVTLFILFVYLLGSSIPLPFAKVTRQFAHLLSSTPTSMMSFMSGANFQSMSLFMIGLNPLMIAMLFMQVLMMTGLFGFDTLSMNQMMIAQQALTLVLAIVQATAFTVAFHLTATVWQATAVIIIMTAGAMFVTWLGVMNMHFGIGGTVTLILFNIISGSIPMIRKAIKQILKLQHPYWCIAGLIVLAFFLMIFWIAFSRAYYPLKTINISLSSKEKPVIIPIGLNMGAMMMYMVGMALLMLPSFLASLLGPDSLFANPQFDALICGLMTFGLFYFFSFVQFSPRQQAKNFRNNNTYIPNIHPGKPTQRYLTKLMWIVCFPGAVLNTIQLVFGLMGSQFLGKYASLTVIPMNIVMIVMIMGGLRDTLLTLIFPRKYSQLAKKERAGQI